jgi:predicted amidohydrolase YtcJ
MFSDGSLGSETAEMLAPYEGRKHTGAQTISTEALNDAVDRAIGGGIAVMIHAIGDGANRRVLDAIELALMSYAPDTLRSPTALPNRIEHCQIVHPDDLSRFAQLGVIASMQPIHATADMETADRLWGARCATAYAWRALQERGAVLAFGSDAPVEPLNPWLSVHAAVTRQRPGNLPLEGWYPEQRISLASALRGFTVGAAVAAGAAHELGTLAPGMLADLAVLTADPFKISPQELHAVRAELTMIEGQVVWEG